MTDSSKTNAQEDEVMEFLNSLPDQKDGGSPSKKEVKDMAIKAKKEGGKTDQEILDFLDELEATNKDENSTETNTKQNSEKPIAEASPVAPPPATSAETTTDKEQINDPITSFSRWWSNSGSAKVSSGISSLLGTAQSFKDQAQKTADSAIKRAKEQGVDTDLRSAFKKLGITGVLEGDRELTNEEKDQLLKLPDAEKALASLNSGISVFSSHVSDVLQKLNSADEVIDVKLVHDMKNYPNLAGYVQHNFEDVMSSQVDGTIEVNVSQAGTKTIKDTDNGDGRDIGLFQGKLSDADRLVQANIESIMGSEEKNEKNAKKTETKSRKTQIYIGLLAVSVNSGDKQEGENGPITIDENDSSSFCFTATLIDKTHDITITNRSQAFPVRWSEWLDGHYTKKDEEVDPAEWIVDWIEQGLDQTFGVMAQSYVIMRMGY